MAAESAFADLIRRVRAGDDQAAAELVREYEPMIRLAIRVRLKDPGLRRLLDSVDICQSVLGNFFVRMVGGQFEVEQPEQLIKLLVTMARNRLRNHADQQQAARRDYRRNFKGRLDEQQLPATDASPSQIVANQELLQEFRRHLSPEERQLADLRALGRTWPEIAAERGGSADTLRVQLTRAIDRVAQQLGLEA
jgi:RNA polymerase sigma-70 factor (ECF subfamily)